MHLLSRNEVCEKLKITKMTSYRIIYATPSTMINNQTIVNILNGRRRGELPYVSDIPSDIVDAKSIASEFGIPLKKISSWCQRRISKIPPHYRLTSHTIRFRRSIFRKWIEEQTTIKGA